MKHSTETTELSRLFRPRNAARACLLLALAPLLFSTKLLAQIYVANGGDRAVRVYAANATGDAAPLRTFGGPTQFVTRNDSPALHLRAQELFVAGGLDDNIGAYDLTGAGDPVLPIRLIEGPSTGLAFVLGIAVDTVHDEVVVASAQTDSIVTFNRAASGDIAPLRTIVGVATELDFPAHPFIDLDHDEIFVVSRTPFGILVFPRSADGNVAPLRTISGSFTRLGSARTVFVDLEHDEIFVTQYDAAEVLVFPRDGNGNIPPLRVITGPNTGIGRAFGVVLTQAGELLVSDDTDDSILVFQRLDDGDVAPQRTIVGAATLLNGPSALISVQAVGDGLGNAVSIVLFADGFE